MESIHILFLLTFFLYIFIWIVKIYDIKKKSVKYIKYTLMFLILPTFWLFFIIMVLDVNFPIVPAKTEQVLVLDNTGNSLVKCIIFEKYYDEDSWRPAYRLQTARHTPFFEINAGAIDTCRLEATSASHVFACASLNKSGSLTEFRGKLYEISDFKPIYVRVNELKESLLTISGFSFSHEVNRLFFFFIAIIGIWSFAVNTRESHLKLRVYAVASAVTLLCLYLSWKFVQTIILLS